MGNRMGPGGNSMALLVVLPVIWLIGTPIHAGDFRSMVTSLADDVLGARYIQVGIKFLYGLSGENFPSPGLLVDSLCVTSYMVT